MRNIAGSIRLVNASETGLSGYRRCFADCVVLTHDGRLLLQQRPAQDAGGFVLSPFGGHMEAGEVPVAAMVRELHEELGAVIAADDAVFLGAITEAAFDHQDLVHVYFWHDRANSITGCYEWEPRYFDTAAAALALPELMDHAVWALEECIRRGLLK